MRLHSSSRSNYKLRSQQVNWKFVKRFDIELSKCESKIFKFSLRFQDDDTPHQVKSTRRFQSKVDWFSSNLFNKEKKNSNVNFNNSNRFYDSILVVQKSSQIFLLPSFCSFQTVFFVHHRRRWPWPSFLLTVNSVECDLFSIETTSDVWRRDKKC